jgi:hypothetical protein
VKPPTRHTSLIFRKYPWYLTGTTKKSWKDNQENTNHGKSNHGITRTLIRRHQFTQNLYYLRPWRQSWYSITVENHGRKSGYSRSMIGVIITLTMPGCRLHASPAMLIVANALPHRSRLSPLRLADASMACHDGPCHCLARPVLTLALPSLAMRDQKLRSAANDIDLQPTTSTIIILSVWPPLHHAKAPGYPGRHHHRVGRYLSRRSPRASMTLVHPALTVRSRGDGRCWCVGA